MNDEFAPSPYSAREERTLQAWKAGRIGRMRGHSPEVLFGQVREDAHVEAAALRQVTESGIPAPSVISVGSGGCTGFGLLATTPVSRLTLVDINSAQTHLLRFKAALLAQLPHDQILQAVNSNARPAWNTLHDPLPADTRTFWHLRRKRLGRGLNQCGLIDQRIARAVALLNLLQPPGARDALLHAHNATEQAQAYRKWNRGLLYFALRIGLSRPVLRAVYGSEFARLAPPNLLRAVWEHFERALRDIPARENPYLWQVFAGRYPPDTLPLYLQAANLPRVQAGLTNTEVVTSEMVGFLETLPPRSVHFGAFSNILEGMGEAFHQRLWRAWERVAHPQSIAVVRYFFPPPPTHSFLPPSLHVDGELSRRLETIDRSLFCLHTKAVRLTPDKSEG